MKNTQTLWTRIKCHWQLYLFLLIPFTIVVIFHYIPMVGIQIAFKRFNAKDGIFGSPWCGMDQFLKFFKSHMFLRVIKNTLLLSMYGLIAGFPLPIILALALNSMNHIRYRKIIQFTLYVPHFISVVVMVGIVMQILNPRIGLYGTIGQFINNGKYPRDLLEIPQSFYHIYVWSGIWQSIGWSSIIYISALSSSDENLHEAMKLDGATRFQRVRYLDFQCIKPTATILLIMNCGHIMSVGFEKVLLLQNNLNLSASEVISTYVYKVGLASLTPNYSYGAAIGLFNSVINFVLLVSVNAVARRVKDGTSLW